MGMGMPQAYRAALEQSNNTHIDGQFSLHYIKLPSTVALLHYDLHCIRGTEN